MQCRPHPRHAGLDVSCDVFEHDDRIIDDKAGRDRQRHERQIVEAVAQQIHHPEGADQRDRYRDTRDQGGAKTAQAGEDNQNDEADCNDEGAFDLVQRAADRPRPVQYQLDVDGSRDRGFELRQDRLYALDGIDDVCTRLPAEDDHNCGLAVG